MDKSERNRRWQPDEQPAGRPASQTDRQTDSERERWMIKETAKPHNGRFTTAQLGATTRNYGSRD